MSLHRPPGLAVDGEPAVVRPVAERDDPRPLHRAADAGVRALAQAAGAVLPVRGDAARRCPTPARSHSALFPAAPPWTASERGLIPFLANPAGVQSATSPLPTDSGPLYRLVDGNPYAAVPSLHGGYSLLVFLFVADAGVEHAMAVVGRRPAALYPLIQTHRRRLHGQPLRRRPADRRRLRRRRAATACGGSGAGRAGPSDRHGRQPPPVPDRSPEPARAGGSPPTATR